MTSLMEYDSYAKLAAAHLEGKDFVVETRHGNLGAFIVAPHGGRIEPNTEYIARKIAGKDLSLHIFCSHLSPKKANLHITSTNYDHPDALALAAQCNVGVGIHGRRAKDGDDEIWIGGLNTAVRNEVGAALVKAGFRVRLEGHRFPATNPNNICNCAKEAGIQLEMPPGLRTRLRQDMALMKAFRHAIWTGLGL